PHFLSSQPESFVMHERSIRDVLNLYNPSNPLEKAWTIPAPWYFDPRIGQLRAFCNVCRHHAAAVVPEEKGCAKQFRCPYHGWTYGNDGALKGMVEFE